MGCCARWPRRGATRSCGTTTHAGSATTRPTSSNSSLRAAARRRRPVADGAARRSPARRRRRRVRGARPGDQPVRRAGLAANTATCALDYIAARLVESGDRHVAHASCGATSRPRGARPRPRRLGHGPAHRLGQPRQGRRRDSGRPRRPRDCSSCDRRSPNSSTTTCSSSRSARPRRRSRGGSMSDTGHIELERAIDSITVGVRHRKDPGDLDRADGVHRGGRPAPAHHDHPRRRARLRVAPAGGRTPARLAHLEGLGPLRHLRQALAPARPAGREPAAQAAHTGGDRPAVRRAQVLGRRKRSAGRPPRSSAGQGDGGASGSGESPEPAVTPEPARRSG